jgi:integrase
LMRDTGMRNQRELYSARIENLDWESRVIFVPESKTPEGRRLVPMSRRVFELCVHGAAQGQTAGCFRPSVLLRVKCAQ